jgi:Leu/Phe-tRNA-protein transferase
VEFDSDGDQFNYYRPNLQEIRVNTEIKRYNNGDFPMDKKGDVLGWWKVSCNAMLNFLVP